MSRGIRCAIVGSEGYIGRNMAYFLEKMGADVTCYDLKEVTTTVHNYKFVDITNMSSLENIDLNVDYLFLFSGMTGTYAGFDKYEQFVSVNELGLLNLLTAIRNSAFRPHIIFPSTRLVYKGKNEPLKETDELEAKTVYAANKLASEQLLHAYQCSFDIKYTIFRICVPYGNLLGMDYSYGTIGFFLNQALHKKQILLYGKGEIKRTFSHIYDLCNQIYKTIISESGVNDIFNVGGESFSLYEVATCIAERSGASVDFVEWPDRDFKIESGDTYFDDRKIKNVVGEYQYKAFYEFIQNLNI